MMGAPPGMMPRGPRSGGRMRMFAAFSERDFAWFFAGNSAFFLAMQMNFILRGYLAFDLTGKAVSLAAIAVAIALPMLVVAPIGGVVADRVDKRRLLIVTQSLAAASDLEEMIRGQGNKSERARKVGRVLAERARERGLSAVVFDRGGFSYAGRVRALAEAAREEGLVF